MQKIFSYRCARLQFYIQTYLNTRNIQYLVGSVTQQSIYNAALLNYLFKHNKAGVELYDTPSPLQDVLLVVNKDNFYWLLDSLESVNFVANYISGLSNHYVVCSQNFQLATQKHQFELIDLPKISEKEYIELMQHGKNDALAFEQSGKDVKIHFISQIVKQATQIAVAGPLTEEKKICDVMQQSMKVVPVHQSLMQLVFGHFDGGNFKPVEDAVQQLKRLHFDLVREIDQAPQKCNQLHQYLSKPQVECSLPKDPAVKFVPIVDQHKNQIGTNGIYDIYLSHPRIPVIYRQPYIIDGGLASLQLTGFICSLMEEALDTLTLLMKQEKECTEKFKDYLKEKLLKDQPVAYIEPLMDFIKTLKVSFQEHQFENSEKIFGRPIINIQLASQLKITVNNQFSAQTLFFGRSFIVTPQGVLNLSKFDVANQGLFKLKIRPDLQQNSIDPDLDELAKIVKLKLGMLIYDNGVGHIKQIDGLEFDGQLRYSDFQAQLIIPFMKQVTINFKSKPTQKYFQFQQLFNTGLDEDKMMPCMLNKNGMFCSNNLGLLLKQFGNYVYGYFCQQFMKYKTDENVELEGFFIQVDLQNSNNQNLFRKHVYEVIQNDVSIMDLKDYKFEIPETPDQNDSDLKKLQNSYNQHELLMLESDIRYAFGQIGMNYDDKLISKSIEPLPKVNNDLKAILISYDETKFYQTLNQVVKSVSDHFYNDKFSKQSTLQKVNGNAIFVCSHGEFSKFYRFIIENYKHLILIQIGQQKQVNAVTENLLLLPFTTISEPVQNCVISQTKSPNTQLVSVFFNEFGQYKQQMVDKEEVDLIVKNLQFKTVDQLNIVQKMSQIDVKKQIKSKNYELHLQNPPNAKQILNLLLQTQFMKKFLQQTKKISFKFGKFIVEFLQNTFVIDINQITQMEKMVVEAVDFDGIETVIQQFILMLQEEFSKQEIYEAKVQEYCQKQEQEELQQYIAKQPLPDGWFVDCGRYMDWNGNTQQERPDLEQLIAKFNQSKK
uniref:Uncharacterized protein n=1 Tax=Trepomonas sp. PC1 TaxID=1076344 RepID=A0A146KEM6_9EUKA|eukprot:JAP93956.1 Hypothetical protein TPC1_13561 [Trepomonas sp. PC1]